MPRKSLQADVAEKLESEDIETFAVLILSKDGERVYLHQFEDDIDALEFVESMSASLKTDILRSLMKRMLN